MFIRSSHFKSKAQVVFKSKVTTKPELGSELVLDKEKLSLYGRRKFWKPTLDLIAEFNVYECYARPDKDSATGFELVLPITVVKFRVKSSDVRDSWIEAINVVSRMTHNVEKRPLVWASLEKQSVHVHVLEGHHVCYESINNPSLDTWCEISVHSKAEIAVGDEDNTSTQDLSSDIKDADVDAELKEFEGKTSFKDGRRRSRSRSRNSMEVVNPEILFAAGEGVSLDLGGLTVVKRSARQVKRRSIFQPLVYKSKNISRTSEPFWDECKSFSAVSKDDSVLVEIFDRKKGYLGEVSICVSDILSEGERGEKDSITLERWFKVKDGDSGLQIPGRVRVRLMATPASKCSDLVDPCDMRLLWKLPSLPIREDLRIFCGTWNLGNEAPELMEAWIFKDSSIGMYAIGLQESEFSPRKPYSTCGVELLSTIKSTIGPLYECVHFLSLWAIRLVIFVRKDLVYDLANITSSVVRNGVGGVMGNKGANVISFNLRHTRFCFVNCHLAAHQNKVKARNQDIREIFLQNVSFMRDMKSRIDAFSRAHYVFWMGDLNYRIHNVEQGDDNSPSDSVFKSFLDSIEAKSFDALYQQDQLVSEMKNNMVLHGFQEARINFDPTFKVERNEYLKYNSKRSPAWCDRVLWKAQKGLKLGVLSYGSCNEVVSSDHKPVRAVFEASVVFEESPRNPIGKAEDAIFIQLCASKFDQLIKPSSSKLNASVFSHCFEDVIYQEADINDDRKVHDYSRIKLKFENYKRLKNSILYVELKDGDVLLGYGSTMLDNLDTSFSVPDNVLVEPPTGVATKPRRSFSGKIPSPVSRKSFTNGLAPLETNQQSSPTPPLQSPNRVKSMSFGKAAPIPVSSILQRVSQSEEKNSPILPAVLKQIEADSDRRSPENLRTSFIADASPTNVITNQSAEHKLFEKDFSDIVVGKMGMQLQTFCYLDTEFSMDIVNNSAFVCNLRGVLRLRFRF